MAILRLVNKSEELTDNELKPVADRFGLTVRLKVRVADVLRLDDKIDPRSDFYSYGLKSHFDFVVCREEYNPAYAVEFDGPYHKRASQVAQDAKKDAICRLYDFPILRVNSNHLGKRFGPMSLLAWIAEVYEMSLAFDEAQQHGHIPWDEGFDPCSLMDLNEDGISFRHPYRISERHRQRLRHLHSKGKIADPMTSGFIGYDANDVMHGIEYVRVTETEGVFAKTGMRPQQFPVALSDLLDEMLSIQLVEGVDRYLAGKEQLTPLNDIYALAQKMGEQYDMARSHSYGPGPWRPIQPWKWNHSNVAAL